MELCEDQLSAIIKKNMKDLQICVNLYNDSNMFWKQYTMEEACKQRDHIITLRKKIKNNPALIARDRELENKLEWFNIMINTYNKHNIYLSNIQYYHKSLLFWRNIYIELYT